MDLEGFGASLLGRVVLVSAEAGDAWIPYEFLPGVSSFSCSILIVGGGPIARPVLAEGEWTFVVRPATAKDWSCVATILRGMGGSVLLVFDVDAPVLPESFVAFMDGVVAEGRTTLTRVWLGVGARVPAIPDAVFFPRLATGAQRQAAYELLKRLPGRREHGPWSALALEDWNSILDATATSGYGIVVSDLEESRWVLFWHNRGDSVTGSKKIRFETGLSWIQTGTRLLEATSPL